MAAITRVEPRPVTPTAMEVTDKGQATEDLLVGELIILSSAGVSKCTAGKLECHGVMLKGAKAGQLAEYGTQGEMDGFSGLTVGNALYPSSSVAGGIDTTATATPVEKIRAIRTTRIRYNLT